jgi:hypothetical protein
MNDLSVLAFLLEKEYNDNDTRRNVTSLSGPVPLFFFLLPSN